MTSLPSALSHLTLKRAAFERYSRLGIPAGLSIENKAKLAGDRAIAEQEFLEAVEEYEKSLKLEQPTEK